jgi:hypothetical protein
VLFEISTVRNRHHLKTAPFKSGVDSRLDSIEASHKCCLSFSSSFCRITSSRVTSFSRRPSYRRRQLLRPQP